MKSPFDQNPEQEPSSDQSYERNLARNYPADERAGIRASDQRAAYQAATLKLNAEKEAQNVKDTSIRLGIEQAKEARAVTADTLANARSSAENAFKEREREFEQKAAEQVAPMLQEIKKRRNPAGYLSFADQTEIDLMFTFASQSKNPNITKMRDQERSLATNVMEREAANLEIRAKEERAKEEANRKFVEEQNKLVVQNQAAGELAKVLKLKPTGIRDGKVVFGDDKPVDTGTRRVTTDPVGRETVSETTPMPPAGNPTSAAPAAPAAPAANPLASIVSSGGKIKKVGDSYNAFDKDGKFIGSYSVGK